MPRLATHVRAHPRLIIAVAAQTSDVGVTSTAMRREVPMQALLSFAFNTAGLAFTINIAASLF